MTFIACFQNITYTLVVVATDSGKPMPFSTSTNVTILVIQPNNFFNPELNQRAYTRSIEKGNAVGTVVLAFSVSDTDVLGPASQVTSVILFGADAKYFTANLTSTNAGVVIATYVII